MKKFLLSLLLISIVLKSNSQVTVPGTRRIIDNTVNVNVQSTSTVKTVDYGKIAIANSMNDANEIKLKEFKDAKFKEDAAIISINPMKAYDLGTDISEKIRGKGNFIKYEIRAKILHESLFSLVNRKFENTSNDGIRTSVQLFSPECCSTKYNVEDSLSYNKINLNDTANIELLELGYVNAKILDKQLDRASIYGFSGFVGTLIGEEKYQNFIKDTYISTSSDGILFKFDVTYSASKTKKIDALKSRRDFLRPVIDKFISAFSIGNYKFKLSN